MSVIHGPARLLFSVLIVAALAGCSKHGNDTAAAGAGAAGGSSGSSSGASGTSGTSGTGGSSSGTSGTSGTGGAGSGTTDSTASGAAGGPAAAAGAAIDDSVITTKLKTALLADTTLKGSHISVETRQGEVVLTGSVTSPSQKDHAAQIAQALNGVKAVNNKLALSK